MLLFLSPEIFPLCVFLKFVSGKIGVSKDTRRRDADSFIVEVPIERYLSVTKAHFGRVYLFLCRSWTKLRLERVFLMRWVCFGIFSLHTTYIKFATLGSEIRGQLRTRPDSKPMARRS